MRLIDADSLMCNVKRAVYTDDLSTTIAVGICESHIKDMPTVDAIPVEWLREWQDEVGPINEWWPIIERIITVWREEQEA